MAIRIESGIPAPTTKYQGGKEVYPFSQLEIGQSLFAPHSEYDANRVRSAAYAAGKRLGMKFRTQTNKHGIRVWRVETD